jgi:hypothetical protein
VFAELVCQFKVGRLGVVCKHGAQSYARNPYVESDN